MSSNLIVNDEYIIEMAGLVEKQGLYFESILSEYSRALIIIAEDGFTSGKFHTGLLAYVEVAKSLKGDITELSKCVRDKLIAFQKDIDDRDKYVY